MRGGAPCGAGGGEGRDGGRRDADRSDADRCARATWSALVEPGDAAAGALVRLLGPVRALEWVGEASRGAPDWSVVRGVAGPERMRLVGAARRWAARGDGLDIEAALADLDRIGGTLVVPGDPGWPAGLDDLGGAAPFALWCRGGPAVRVPEAVAVVGARAATSYGERMAFDLAEGLAARGATVVSGGAYGIDAAAHRGALARRGATVVVLAGGVDRGYPAGNARLFEEVVGAGGALVSEVPPGSLPTKSRFLQRNRLIAALCGATVVVEAAWRSGALSTAHRAADLLRPVGAVPGPVTSAASAGCHRLLREGLAVCVTDVAEVLELLPGGADTGAPGGDLGGGAHGSGADTRGRVAGRSGIVGEPEAGAPVRRGRGADEAGSPGAGGASGAGSATAASQRAGVTAGLDPLTTRVHDALSLRVPADVDVVAVRAGVGVDEARGALGLLELAGLAARRGGGWRASRPEATARSPGLF